MTNIPVGKKSNLNRGLTVIITVKPLLRLYLTIALHIPTAYDFWVISMHTWAYTHAQHQETSFKLSLAAKQKLSLLRFAVRFLVLLWGYRVLLWGYWVLLWGYRVLLWGYRVLLWDFWFCCVVLGFTMRLLSFAVRLLSFALRLTSFAVRLQSSAVRFLIFLWLSWFGCEVTEFCHGLFGFPLRFLILLWSYWAWGGGGLPIR